MKNPPSKSVCLIVTNEISAITFYRGYLRFLRERGWHVTIVASGTPRLLELAREEGVEVRLLPMEREPAPLQDIRSLWSAIRLLRAVSPSVLVYATPKASLIGAVAGLLTRVPVRVYQLWGLRLETTRGLWRRVFTVLEKITTRCSTHVVANSRSLAQEAVALRVAKHVITLGEGSSHGVDVERFTPAHLAECEIPQTISERIGHVSVVGYIGRVHRDKGVDVLLDALEIVRSRGLALALLIVGPNEDAALTARIDNYSQDGLIVVSTGGVDDVRPYLNRMDILCLPTYREGFPNVVLEAAAAGRATITTTATGARDSVIDGETGLLVAPGDALGLANAIEQLLNDQDRRATLGENARLRVEQHFRQVDVFGHQEAFLNDQYLKLRPARQSRIG